MLPLLRKAKRMSCFLTPILLPSAPISVHNFNATRSLTTSHLLLPRLLGLRPKIGYSGKSWGLVRGMATKMDSIQQNPESISYLNQQEAAEIDEILMGPLGFSVDQLMELAGLSVATAVAEVYKPSEYSRVLTICGPGNNGGDGLVAARHLYHFGYKPFICYPKRTAKPLYNGLITQLESLSVPFLSLEDLPKDLSDSFDILVDAMFGFSFHGSPRPPFDDLIHRLVALKIRDDKHQKSPAIVSIDIPSGWHVEEGDLSGEGVKPDMLVSLTAPKLCAKSFSGLHHFLGGRFVPPSIRDKFNLQLPAYPGTSMCVRIGKPPKIDISSMRENYISPALLEEEVAADPFDQFQKWFDDAMTAGLKEPNAMALSTTGKDGKPSSRIVLLKGFDKDGFVWYTNYEGSKGQQIAENPHAALLFYWDDLNRQVRIEGPVKKVSDEESEQYFHSRPRGSQLGAIASKQSTIIPGRQFLIDEYKQLEAKYSDGLIPKPKHWGGYRLKPEMFEFWQGQQSRLHDRYLLQDVSSEDIHFMLGIYPTRNQVLADFLLMCKRNFTDAIFWVARHMEKECDIKTTSTEWNQRWNVLYAFNNLKKIYGMLSNTTNNLEKSLTKKE